jgi:outer membrane protein OmpA-like peptidoglycan-associated protein
MIDAAIAIREAFHNPVSVTSDRPEDQVLVRRLIERRAAEGEDEGASGKYDKTQSLLRGDYHSPVGLVFFEQDSAQLTESGAAPLESVSEHVRGLKLVVEVRGHASSAEAYKLEDRGMRLSFERSLAVAQALVGKGMSWKQIRLVPCGDNELLSPHAYDREAHATNSRVEIVVTEQVPGG